MGFSGTNLRRITTQAFSYTSNITAGNSTDFTLQPNQGEIYAIINMRFNANSVPASGSGTHYFIGIYDETKVMYAFLCQSDHASNCRINIDDKLAFTGDVAEAPSDASSQYQVITNRIITVSHDHPLIIRYVNDTDATQTNDIEGIVLIEVYGEA